MTVPADSLEERRKLNAALQRAIPITRMLDYGVPAIDTALVEARTAAAEPEAWDTVCEQLARQHSNAAATAEAALDHPGAAASWRAAGALLMVAQLAFNADVKRKRSLYAAGQAAFVAHGRCAGDLAALKIDTPDGVLFGWQVSPAAGAADATVVIIGGLSGWGAIYLDMARALNRRGIACILAEGPGQGSTRMSSGLVYADDAAALLRRFVDLAEAAHGTALGMWGNSFGGLFAAQVAVADPRIRALCINGAPMAPVVPAFRTAVEQMQAVFGTSDEEVLARRVAALRLEPGRHRSAAAMLVVEGGADPLVPLGSQADFFALAPGRVHDTFSWPDGQHTIYNHARERNERVAEWFRRQLAIG